MFYKRMKADKSVCHDSDFSRLPKDAVIIKTFYKYSYQQISYILEHKYQVIRYKRKHSVKHVFFPQTSVINFTSKKQSYDDTRRSSRDNELLQRAQSDL